MKKCIKEPSMLWVTFILHIDYNNEIIHHHIGNRSALYSSTDITDKITFMSTPIIYNYLSTIDQLS